MDNQLYIEYGELEQRARQLEAECAAMRKALEEARDLYECAYYEGVYTHMGYTERREKWNDEAQEILANMQQALAPDAGKALLERVQRLEAALKTVVQAYIVPEPQRQEALSLAMNEVFAALEGGAE